MADPDAEQIVALRAEVAALRALAPGWRAIEQIVALRAEVAALRALAPGWRAIADALRVCANELDVVVGSKWRHRKRGGVYVVEGVAKFQGSSDVTRPIDNIDVVVYRSEDDVDAYDMPVPGRLWTRPLVEFVERFKEV